jgi:hypothetical protein
MPAPFLSEIKSGVIIMYRFLSHDTGSNLPVLPVIDVGQVVASNLADAINAAVTKCLNESIEYLNVWRENARLATVTADGVAWLSRQGTYEIKGG